MKIAEGDKIVAIENSELRYGEIEKIYDDMFLAIVKFDDGETKKIGMTYIAHAPEPVINESDEEKNQILLGAVMVLDKIINNLTNDEY